MPLAVVAIGGNALTRSNQVGTIAEQFAKAGVALSPEQQMSIRSSTRSTPGGDVHGALALKLARIGILLERPELIEEGISAARAELEAERAQQEAQKAQQEAQKAQQEAQRAEEEASRRKALELENARLREELEALKTRR